MPEKQGDQAMAHFFQAQWVLVFFVLAGLGLALLLNTRLTERIERGVRAGTSRRTATFLTGAGACLAGLVMIAAVDKAHNAVLSVLVFSALILLFVLGFAADSLRTGRRLTTRDGAAALTLGWLVRTGALAVPLAWPVVGAYLLVSALGNPIVGLFVASDVSDAGDENDTTAPSAGSSLDR